MRRCTWLDLKDDMPECKHSSLSTFKQTMHDPMQVRGFYLSAHIVVVGIQIEFMILAVSKQGRCGDPSRSRRTRQCTSHTISFVPICEISFDLWNALTFDLLFIFSSLTESNAKRKIKTNYIALNLNSLCLLNLLSCWRINEPVFTENNGYIQYMHHCLINLACKLQYLFNFSTMPFVQVSIWKITTIKFSPTKCHFGHANYAIFYGCRMQEFEKTHSNIYHHDVTKMA